MLGNVCMFVALWIVSRGCERRKHFYLRAALSFVAFCGLRYLFFSLVFPLAPSPLNQTLKMIGFTVIFVLLGIVMVVCFDVDFWRTLFCANTAYCTQHIAVRIFSIVDRLCGKDIGYWDILIFVASCAVVLGTLYFIMSKMKITKIIIANKALLLVSTLIIATSIILDMLIMDARRYGWDLRYFNNITSIIIVLLIMLFQVSIVRRQNVEMERDTIKEILENEREQYLYEKRMIDVINIKCHDLKHQLNSDVKGQMTDEIKMAVDAYACSFKTGNVALDVILTRKSFSCMEKKIELNCLADGKILSCMKETEIYSLFGNILDNAIEAVERLPEGEKRVILVNVEKRGGFVFIREENYYGGRLECVGGIPQTTKVDKNFHGYGMKSIVSIVKNYGGEIRIETVEDRFTLKIAIPVAAEASVQ